MSQTTEVGECSWLHAYCATLTASLLLWGQMQREGDTSKVFRRNLKRPQGRYFKPKELCKEAQGWLYDKDTLLSHQKDRVFTGFSGTTKGIFNT